MANEIERLGAGHPLIRTQYPLQALDGPTCLFSPESRLLLRRSHARVTDPAAPNDHVTYIARIDFGGGVEVPTDGPHIGDTDPTKHRGQHGSDYRRRLRDLGGRPSDYKNGRDELVDRAAPP